MITEAGRSVLDMNAIIERCLQVDQLDDQRLKPHRTLCDVVHELRVIGLQCAMPSRIHLQTPEDAPIDTDPALLRIILNNLIDNALKYAAPDTAISVEVSDDFMLPETSSESA